VIVCRSVVGERGQHVYITNDGGCAKYPRVRLGMTPRIDQSLFPNPSTVEY